MMYGLLAAMGVGMVVLFLVRRGKADPAAIRAHLEAGALVLDVRSAEEFAGGHVEGALNVPVGELGARLGELGEPGKVVVYCASGIRSAVAAKLLAGAGFDVLNAGTARQVR